MCSDLIFTMENATRVIRANLISLRDLSVEECLAECLRFPGCRSVDLYPTICKFNPVDCLTAQSDCSRHKVSVLYEYINTEKGEKTSFPKLSMFVQ